jgi:hypothetical protein
MTNAPIPMGAVGRVSRLVFWVSAAYWAVYVLVAPLTNVDSQMYNIARLELAMRGGLFDNGHFTSVYQLIWPWTFDAVHLPFMEMGWGYALPSFCCLMGTCYVVYAMMQARYGPDAAWVAAIALMGLPCLVYQGTSTKNDIPVLFAGAVWVYAHWRWGRDGRRGHIFWMVLAIAFLAGSKTTGVPYGMILALWTLWDLRADRRLALQTFLGLIVAVALFGSVETYIETARQFGNPLGPPQLIRDVRNVDGVRGAAANMSRYVAGSIYLGPSRVGSAAPATRWIGNAEQSFLAWTGLGDAGVGPSLRHKTLYFIQSGFEELSGFGPIGMVAMATALAAGVIWRPGKPWWRLAIIALFGFLVASDSIAYSYWGNRYLITWYAVATVAVVCALWEPGVGLRRPLRWGFAALSLACVVATPLLSFNRGPAAIAASLLDRDAFETSYFPIIGKMRERLRALRRATPGSRVFYVVTGTSAVMPYLEDPQLEAIVVTPTEFQRLLSGGQVANGDYVIKDGFFKSPVLQRLEMVSAPGAEGGIVTDSIYEVQQPRAAR